MSTLKIAIQKSGRLNTDSLNLLKECGIKISNGKDQLKVSASNFPIELYYLRNSDIPQYIEDGVVDAGILGENTILEKGKNIKTVKKLGFSKCRVSLAVTKDIEDISLDYFRGKRIATSYPNTLNKYLKANNIEAETHIISGSVEIAPNIGLADAVCDIVSSGSTLFKNGLKESQVIMQSEAVIAISPNLPKEQADILEKLLFRIQAVLRAKSTKYILLNVPNDKIQAVSKILPVLKSPTVLPLVQEGWSSLHSVIEEEQFWNVLDQLKDAGAEDILIVPIDKMISN